MGLFFGGEEEHFAPGVRKSGFPRYREVLEGSYKEFFLVGFLTLIFYIPFAAGMVLAVLSSSLLVALAAGLLGGAIAGPGLACMYDLILRRLRDDQSDWWYSWKRSMKQNWRASLLPGIEQHLFLAVIVYAGALIHWGAAALTPGVIVFLAAATVLVVMLMSAWWPQVVLFEQRSLIQQKNAILFVLLHFGKALLAALLQIAWWAVMLLFLPWTAFVVPILGVWYILFLAVHILYPDLDAELRIEEQIEEQFPGEMGT